MSLNEIKRLNDENERLKAEVEHFKKADDIQLLIGIDAKLSDLKLHMDAIMVQMKDNKKQIIYEDY